MTMFGPGTEGMTFGQRLGHLGRDFLGKMANNMGGPLGNIMGTMMGSDGGGMNQALGNVLGASVGGGGAGGQGVDQKLVGGGQQAVVEAGRGFLNQGYTVYNHKNFKNNRWRKGPPNRSGYDPSGKQRRGRGGLYSKNLAFDVSWHGKGDKTSKLQMVADQAYGNRRGLKLTSIIGNKWGKWIFGRDKKAPGSHGVRNKIQFGFGDNQVAGSGNIGMSGSDLEQMKTVIAQASGGDPKQMTIMARSIMNQAGVIDQGAGANFGGAQTMGDILSKIQGSFNPDAQLSPSLSNKASAAIFKASDTNWMTSMLGGQGFSEPQTMALLNSTTFKNTGIYNKGDDSSQIKFGETVFSTEGNKFFNDYMKNTDLGVANGENPMFPSTKETSTKAYQKNRRGSAFQSSTNYGGGQTGASSGNASSGSILGTPSGGQQKQGNNQSQERQEAYALKKVYSDRSYAREQITERTRRLVAETMAAVEAHNASVRANVAAAASAVERLKSGGGGMRGLMGAKASLNAANLQSNFSVAKFA